MCHGDSGSYVIGCWAGRASVCAVDGGRSLGGTVGRKSVCWEGDAPENGESDELNRETCQLMDTHTHSWKETIIKMNSSRQI